MASIRFLSLAGLALIAFASVACVQPVQEEGEDTRSSSVRKSAKSDSDGYDDYEGYDFGDESYSEETTYEEPAGGETTQSSECDGCVADGSYCIWTSKSDWGKGSYSGAVIECESYCCQ